VSDTPYDQKLFDESSQGEQFGDVTEYRKLVMGLKYLEKTRPDIKLPIAYLTTKMQTPTEKDWEKLNRVKKYINRTKDFVFRVKPERNNVQISVSADASFAPFSDGKSNTGFAIMIGGSSNASFISKSGEQKSVTNNSAGAELVSAAEAVENTLWSYHLVTDIGFKQETVILEQDNQSTIRMIERGPSSTGRTKWINVKELWVNQFVQDGTITMKYVPSLELIADGFTKPLSKKAFFTWRARVLNHKGCVENE
jgi:hypothetical protein